MCVYNQLKSKYKHIKYIKIEEDDNYLLTHETVKK